VPQKRLAVVSIGILIIANLARPQLGNLPFLPQGFSVRDGKMDKVPAKPGLMRKSPCDEIQNFARHHSFVAQETESVCGFAHCLGRLFDCAVHIPLPPSGFLGPFFFFLGVPGVFFQKKGFFGGGPPSPVLRRISR